ncbi:MAG: hypothetical protein JWP59_330 [Massilia sp.]|nr:hypothetical protein [Massilia sp.]
MQKPLLTVAANGRLCLTFEEYASSLMSDISMYLETKLGFARVGPTVVGLDEGISQDFVKDDIRISAGWNNWSGEYLLSTSDDGDALLTTLFAAITCENVFNPSS